MGRAFMGWPASKTELEEIVVTSLKKAGLFEEVKDRLAAPGTGLSGRPAAAPVHRPRHRGQPRSHPDGRALLRARSDRHREDRGADRRAAAEFLHRHRHPFDAAGGARVAAHRVLPSRASWSRSATPTRSSPRRRTSAPRIISPAASAEPERTRNACPIISSKPMMTISAG